MKAFTKLLALTLLTLLASACTDVDPTQTSPAAPQQVNLVRKNQRVLRYDCPDRLISDRFETVNSIQKTLLVKAPKTENLWYFTAINRNNGSRTGGLINDSGKLTVNISPTLFHMRVQPGLNHIDYTFEYCADSITDSGELGQASGCSQPIEEQRGEIFVFVNYSEETLSGELVIKPSLESCRTNEP